MNIYVSGSLAFDNIMNYSGKFADHIVPEKIHALSLSFVVEKMSVHFGGTAGNIAYSLGLLGEHPAIFSTAGNDFSKYSDHLKKNGVDISRVRIIENVKTMSATIMTDSTDSQIAGIYLGSMAFDCDLKEEGISTDSIAIVAPGNLEDMVSLSQFYRRRGIPYVFDPGQQISRLSNEELIECIKGSKALILNDYEMNFIMEKTGLGETDLVFATDILITTFGSRGSKIKTKTESYEIPAIKVKNPVDPTGAGDAYRAGILRGLISGWSLEIVGKFASVVAAYVVEKYGSQEHFFEYSDILERYRQNFGPLVV